MLEDDVAVVDAANQMLEDDVVVVDTTNPSKELTMIKIWVEQYIRMEFQYLEEPHYATTTMENLWALVQGKIINCQFILMHSKNNFFIKF